MSPMTNLVQSLEFLSESLARQTMLPPEQYQGYWRCEHHPHALLNFFEGRTECVWECHTQELRRYHNGTHPLPKSWPAVRAADSPVRYPVTDLPPPECTLSHGPIPLAEDSTVARVSSNSDTASVRCTSLGAESCAANDEYISGTLP